MDRKTFDNDISENENIIELYEKSVFKKWIKLISINNTVLFDEYNNKEYFIPVADIVLDDESFTNGKKKGEKKRNTLIQFIPKISKTLFSKRNEWLYIIVINGRVVKLGGTRTGLKDRCGSYLCGHHIKERGKSGDCSKTNGFLYNTIFFYLKLGCKVEMYGYELPVTESLVLILNKERKIITQTYHTYESIFIKDYNEQYNGYPTLSDNCDPNYKV